MSSWRGQRENARCKECSDKGRPQHERPLPKGRGKMTRPQMVPRRNNEIVRKRAPQNSGTWATLPVPHAKRERHEGVNGHWRTRMWETSAIEIWGTTRDLGFPVSKDKDQVRSARDATEDRRINLVISPEILSFCRRKIEERDQ